MLTFFFQESNNELFEIGKLGLIGIGLGGLAAGGYIASKMADGDEAYGDYIDDNPEIEMYQKNAKDSINDLKSDNNQIETLVSQRTNGKFYDPNELGRSRWLPWSTHEEELMDRYNRNLERIQNIEKDPSTYNRYFYSKPEESWYSKLSSSPISVGLGGAALGAAGLYGYSKWKAANQNQKIKENQKNENRWGLRPTSNQY